MGCGSSASPHPAVDSDTGTFKEEATCRACSGLGSDAVGGCDGRRALPLHTSEGHTVQVGGKQREVEAICDPAERACNDDSSLRPAPGPDTEPDVGCEPSVSEASCDVRSNAHLKLVAVDAHRIDEAFEIQDNDDVMLTADPMGGFALEQATEEVRRDWGIKEDAKSFPCSTTGQQCSATQDADFQPGVMKYSDDVRIGSFVKVLAEASLQSGANLLRAGCGLQSPEQVTSLGSQDNDTSLRFTSDGEGKQEELEIAAAVMFQADCDPCHLAEAPMSSDEIDLAVDKQEAPAAVHAPDEPGPSNLATAGIRDPCEMTDREETVLADVEQVGMTWSTGTHTYNSSAEQTRIGPHASIHKVSKTEQEGFAQSASIQEVGCEARLMRMRETASPQEVATVQEADYDSGQTGMTAPARTQQFDSDADQAEKIRLVCLSETNYDVDQSGAGRPAGIHGARHNLWQTELKRPVDEGRARIPMPVSLQEIEGDAEKAGMPGPARIQEIDCNAPQTHAGIHDDRAEAEKAMVTSLAGTQQVDCNASKSEMTSPACIEKVDCNAAQTGMRPHAIIHEVHRDAELARTTCPACIQKVDCNAAQTGMRPHASIHEIHCDAEMARATSASILKVNCKAAQTGLRPHASFHEVYCDAEKAGITSPACIQKVDCDAAQTGTRPHASIHELYRDAGKARATSASIQKVDCNAAQPGVRPHASFHEVSRDAGKAGATCPASIQKVDCNAAQTGMRPHASIREVHCDAEKARATCPVSIQEVDFNAAQTRLKTHVSTHAVEAGADKAVRTSPASTQQVDCNTNKTEITSRASIQKVDRSNAAQTGMRSHASINEVYSDAEKAGMTSFANIQGADFNAAQTGVRANASINEVTCDAEKMTMRPLGIDQRIECTADQMGIKRPAGIEEVGCNVRQTSMRAHASIRELNCTEELKGMRPLAITPEEACGAAQLGTTSASSTAKVNYAEEGRRLLERVNLRLEGRPARYDEVNPIYRHPQSGAVLYVGGQKFACSRESLDGHRVRRIVFCQDEDGDMPFSGNPDFVYLPFPVGRWRDGKHVDPPTEEARGTWCGGLFIGDPCATPARSLAFWKPLLDFVETELAAGNNVLIHCLAGAHRAGTCGIACLMHLCGLDFREATTLARTARPAIKPIGSFPLLLRALEGGLALRAELPPLHRPA